MNKQDKTAEQLVNCKADSIWKICYHTIRYDTIR